MTIFKRQSDQMKAVVAEAIEALEATKEVVTKIKSEPPEAITIPAPPMPETIRPESVGRYAKVPRPTPRVVPPPLPKGPKPPPLPPKAPAVVPRPAMRPAPPKAPSPSDPDDS